MKKIIFTTFLVLFSVAGWGQEAQRGQSHIALQLKADAGDPEAQLQLGLNYYNGTNAAKDYAKAVYWFRKSAEQDNVNALSWLGSCYYSGEGVDRDYSQAIYWDRKAAERGNMYAQNRMGIYYYDAKGVEKDYAKAAYWYRKAGEQGHTNASRMLGVCYYYGYGIEQDFVKAVEWFRKSAEAGSSDAQSWLGACYQEGNGGTKDLQEAVKWYRKSADQGNVYGLTNLAQCYYNGTGIAKDQAEAFYLFKKAADKGHAMAQSWLGYMYYNGRGVSKDYAQAFSWDRKAADQGNASSQYRMGIYYRDGEGTAKNSVEAVKWFRKSAEAGNVDAQCSLGYLYETGNGVTKDISEAVKWYRKSAEGGNASGQNNLGSCYYNGDGVVRDLTLAAYWWKKAAESGNSTAQSNLDRLYKDGKWTNPEVLTASEHIKQYINDKLSGWQKKSQYESTSDYQRRVNPSTYEAKVKELFPAAVASYVTSPKFANEISKATLSEYDADNNTFLVSFPSLGQIVIKVREVKDAKSLYDNWKSVEFFGADFTPVHDALTGEDKMVLSKIGLSERRSRKEFVWSIADKYAYRQVKIDDNFKAVSLAEVIGGSATDSSPMVESTTVTVGRSQIDTDIPETGRKKPDTYALVVGNERYSKYSQVKYAANDARIFAGYAEKTLGIPRENITLLINATAGQMKEAVDKISNIAQYSRGKAEIVVFYAGHGMPDPESKQAYLMPVDVSGVRNGYRLDDFYSALTRYPSRRVSVFLDACFTGQGREGDYIAEVRGVGIVPKVGYGSGNIVIFSAASNTQYALPDDLNSHGMFTSCLLRKLQQTRGNVTYGDMFSYIKDEVPLNVSKQHSGIIQNPDILFSPAVSSLWSVWKFNE